MKNQLASTLTNAGSDCGDATHTAYEPGMFQNVKVSFLGRYMLADRREFPCQIVEMSPGTACVIAPESGTLGSRVVAYVDHIGRIEGKVQSEVDGGFVMSIIAPARKREKFAAQLTWHANKDLLNLPEDRRHERQVPDIRHSRIILEDGRAYPCKIVDISLSGAGIEIESKPAMGMPVVLGRMRGRVIRHFDGGIAVEFSSVQQGFSVVQANLRVVE